MTPTHVPGAKTEDVNALHDYLSSNWDDEEGIVLKGAASVRQFEYDNFLPARDDEPDWVGNARLLKQRLPMARGKLPGFAGLMDAALQHVKDTTGETDLEVADAHFLRQPGKGASFGPHRDRHSAGLRYAHSSALRSDPPRFPHYKT